jgi:hypothetical protein
MVSSQLSAISALVALQDFDFLAAISDIAFDESKSPLLDKS